MIWTKTARLMFPAIMFALVGCTSAAPETAPQSPQPSQQPSPQPAGDAASGPAPAPAPAITPAPQPEPEPIPEQHFEPGTPEYVVHEFYTWYQAESVARRHPVLNRNLPESVTPAMAEQAYSTVASDPFLCSQNAPRHVLVAASEVGEGEATLTMKAGPWEGPNAWSSFTVKLVLDGERWFIHQVECHRG